MREVTYCYGGDDSAIGRVLVNGRTVLAVLKLGPVVVDVQYVDGHCGAAAVML